MSIKSLVVFTAVVAGTIAFTDRASAQVVTTYSSGYYSPGVVTTSYYTPVVGTSYYSAPLVGEYYTSPYYGYPAYYAAPRYAGVYPAYYGGVYAGYGPRLGWGLRRWW